SRDRPRSRRSRSGPMTRPSWPSEILTNERTTMISIQRTVALLVLGASLIGASARAEDVKAGDLVITQGWSRATLGGAKTGGGFLTIENKGSAPDKLIGANADIAGKVEVHEMAMHDGVMKMRPVEGGLT